MLPLKLATALLLLLVGGGMLLWAGAGPRWERKFRTEARRREIEAERGKRRLRTPGSVAWGLASRVISVGLPALFVIDGLVFRVGVLYAPQFTFFNPFDTPIQIAGFVLAAVGLGIVAIAGRTLAEQVFAKAREERRMITTGIYAHVRHPLYLSFVLIPLGVVLLTLNYFALLLPLAFWFFTDADLEACGRRGKLTFLTTAIECEEEGLRRRFGDEYEQYAQRTGKLFPKTGRPQMR